MVYHLSATKLKTYHRCPRAYYCRYEYGLPNAATFGAAALGNALHQTLAQVYGEWHYQEPLPPLTWLEQCWRQHSNNLSPIQVEEGWQILKQYYESFIQPFPVLRRPLSVEGRIQGRLQFEEIEFKLTGRYDRLDVIDDGLELIDYKSSKEPQPIDQEMIDIQIGLYYLALEQHYQNALRRSSLLYLRTGQQVSFEASRNHKRQVESIISNLALQLRADRTWKPQVGDQCNNCTYARYCPAFHTTPEPLPAKSEFLKRSIQLSLSFHIPQAASLVVHD
ncbi:MAG: PD-(D/E)XK nuclease family protein [Leptolyngbyaceae cyanobacterium MO_188.B28]|nr:PD-(D/E)XK nuclease family protein [Leptolyngbyaceae cyanobacterium MO_188.B28]